MEDWKERARVLADSGMSITRIAERLGKPRSTVGDAISPPQRPCPECGQPQWRNAGKRPQARHCLACEIALRSWLRERRVEIFAGMYNDGWPLAAIKDVFGVGSQTALGSESVEARRRGLIGYRHYGSYAERPA